jgi:Undecaprenyl-phosphate glucose phosphotransferase
VLAGSALVAVGGLVVAFLTKTSEDLSRIWIVLWVGSGMLFLCAARVVLARRLEAWRATGRLRRRVAILGERDGPRLARELQRRCREEVEVVGVFATVDAIVASPSARRADEVVIALPPRAAQRIEMIRRELLILPVDVSLWLDFPSEVIGIRSLRGYHGVALAELGVRPLKDWSAITKRMLDVVGAAALLCATAPLMLAVAALVKLDSRGPALFRQRRFGFNSNVIEVLKFRTMYVDQCDPTGTHATRRRDGRVTRVGKWLRRTSIDELPQVFNVLAGTMSLIGPRPHPIAMKAGDKLYHEIVEQYFARHRVKPGITGWAQVNGCRGEIDSIEKARRRIALDLEYIDRWSVLFDILILLRTVRVLMGRGAY